MKKSLIALLFLPVLAHADQVDMRTAVLLALKNPPGQIYTSSVSLGGMGFNMLAQQSGSNAPFMFEITKILDYPKQGCGKIKMVISQPNGFKQNDFHVTQYMSICSDGTPYAHPDMTLPKE